MLGIQQSIQCGFINVPTDANSINADTFQIFIRNNRNCKRSIITPKMLTLFNLNLQKYAIESIVIHAPYIMNLCTSDLEKRTKYTNIIQEDLKLLKDINAKVYYVIHPGSSQELTVFEALNNVTTCLMKCLDVKGNNTILCPEIMAGAGTQMLSNMEQLSMFLFSIYKVPDIKLCFDTCHVFGAGMEIIPTFKAIEKYVGVVHLNNSEMIFASRRDRHASICDGKINTEELVTLNNYIQKNYPNMPCVLETPGVTLLSDYEFLKEKQYADIII